MKIVSSIIVTLAAVSAFANPTAPAAHTAPAHKAAGHEVAASATTTTTTETATTTPVKKAKKKAAAAATTEAAPAAPAPKH